MLMVVQRWLLMIQHLTLHASPLCQLGVTQHRKWIPREIRVSGNFGKSDFPGAQRRCPRKNHLRVTRNQLRVPRTSTMDLCFEWLGRFMGTSYLVLGPSVLAWASTRVSQWNPVTSLGVLWKGLLMYADVENCWIFTLLLLGIDINAQLLSIMTHDSDTNTQQPPVYSRSQAKRLDLMGPAWPLVQSLLVRKLVNVGWFPSGLVSFSLFLDRPIQMGRP